MAFNYSFRVAVSLAVALLAGVMWTVDVFWGAFYTALLPIALYWQQKLYRHHVRKVLFCSTPSKTMTMPSTSPKRKTLPTHASLTVH